MTGATITPMATSVSAQPLAMRRHSRRRWRACQIAQPKPSCWTTIGMMPKYWVQNSNAVDTA